MYCIFLWIKYLLVKGAFTHLWKDFILINISILNDVDGICEKLIVEEDVCEEDIEDDDKKSSDVDVDVVPSVKFVTDLHLRNMTWKSFW